MLITQNQKLAGSLISVSSEVDMRPVVVWHALDFSGLMLSELLTVHAMKTPIMKLPQFSFLLRTTC